MEELENKKERFVQTVVDIYTKLIEAKYHHDYHYYDSDGCKEDRKMFLDQAISDAIVIELRAKNIFDNEVYCEDVVTLSVDGKKERYLLSSIDAGEYGIRAEIPNTNLGSTFHKDKIISVYGEIGLQLLGKHVGNIITYNIENEKNQHKIEILATRKTKNSYKLSRDEVEAEILENLEKAKKEKEKEGEKNERLGGKKK